MKSILIFIFSTLLVCKVSAQPSILLDVDRMTVSQVIQLVYQDALPEDPYYMAPEVSSDDRMVSFRYSSNRKSFKAHFSTFLDDLGYAIIRKNSTDFIVKKDVFSSDAENPNVEIFYYRPQYRTSDYLVEILSPLFQGKFTSRRQISEPVPSGSQAAPQDSALAQQSVGGNDQLIFSGSKSEVGVLKKLLSQVDNDPGQVFVTGILFEVQTSSQSGSAINLVASLLKNKLNFNFGFPGAADNYVSFQSGDFDAVFRALDSDNRFKILSNPTVRVASGKNAVFTVGEDVPVLGSVTYSSNAMPVQSVDYRSSGVIFDISPTIRDSVIDVSINQEISSFVTTTTGVNNSPTLTKRQIQTQVSMKSGDAFVIGGLRENKTAGGSSKFKYLPDFLSSKNSEEKSSEILLFIKVNRV